MTRGKGGVAKAFTLPPPLCGNPPFFSTTQRKQKGRKEEYKTNNTVKINVEKC
jgi:hypothetical protein